ncbi:hypothetical protein [Halococcoides cellulosivorans]|uniref:hypothetical protein n=1 Tax=Halococcoides cellulosivorans TaxID=1679096 RepID=UPI00131F3DED|nr:hypothetical protein [Halococcoides cellulosivorans]
MSERGPSGRARRGVALTALLAVALIATSGVAVAADPVTETATYRLTPSDPGTVEVDLLYSTPDPLTELSIAPPESASAIETEGFTREGDRFVWDGETDRPRLTLRLAVNETGTERQAAAAPTGSGLIFADTGDWALFTRPSTSVRWTARGDLGFERTSTTDGPGVTGSSMVFLGDHETTTRTVDGERIVYVRPAGVDPAVDPDETLDALEFASRELQVGARDDRILAVAAPTTVDWGVAGLQVGPADFWVQADRSLGAGSTWYHEYVHARQDFETTTETAWTTEAMATYYAALLGLQRDGSFETFQATLAPGTRDTYDDVILSDPGTWHDAAPYRKGSLAVGQTDRRIRLASDGSTFLRVWSVLNRQDGPLTAADLYAAIVAASNDSVAARTRTDVESTGGLSIWSASEHRAAFGASGPRFSVTPATAVVIEGSTRTASADPRETALLGVNESVTLTYRVRNGGDTTGDYDVPVRLGDRTVNRLTGTLDPGESATQEVSVTPDRTGRLALFAGDSVIDLHVLDPPIQVLDVTVSEDHPVTVTAALGGNATVPTSGPLSIEWGDAVILEERVAIAPGANRTVSVEVPNATAGEHTVRVGNTTATVTITDPATSADGPAAGPLVAVLVVLIVARVFK